MLRRGWSMGLVLQLSRAGAGAVAALSAGKGLDLSTDGGEHAATTYVGFYGLAAVLTLTAIVLTVLIERRKHAREEPQEPARRPVSLALQLRDEARRGSELRDRIAADPLTRTAAPLPYDQEIEDWTRRVGELLEGHDDAAHEFLAPVVSPWVSALGALGIEGNQRDRLGRTLRVRVDRLSRIADQLRQTPSAQKPSRVASSLSFGRADIPERAQPIYVEGEDGRPQRVANGRVVRVPVSNAQGATEAKEVHARLRFTTVEEAGPSDTMFFPKPAQAEWVGEPTGSELEINLPGNGRPRLLDVVVVLDEPYPNVYEWTKHSRAAGLSGYEIDAYPFEVEIDVMGSGSGATVPRLRDTLQIESRPHFLRADWTSADEDESTNTVAWP